MRTTYSYTILEIPAETYNSLLNCIREAGQEYLDRYVEGDIIHFTGSEVALESCKKESGDSII